jgi:hypothetical protein
MRLMEDNADKEIHKRSITGLKKVPSRGYTSEKLMYPGWRLLCLGLRQRQAGCRNPGGAIDLFLASHWIARKDSLTLFGVGGLSPIGI